jgi:hypothetical protein
VGVYGPGVKWDNSHAKLIRRIAKRYSYHLSYQQARDASTPKGGCSIPASVPTADIPVR